MGVRGDRCRQASMELANQRGEPREWRESRSLELRDAPPPSRAAHSRSNPAQPIDSATSDVGQARKVMAATGRAAKLLTRAYSTATRVSLPDLLLRQAVPLVAASGFSANTLSRASLSLPAPHTPSTSYSRHTIDNLFPSAPPSNTFKTSLTREQLVADAQGTAGEHERIGPAKALVEAWLEEGRRVMVEHVEGNQRWRGEAGVREGVKERIRYNETVLPDLSAVS